MKQSRWQSKAAWISVFALIGFVLANYGLFEKIGLNNETYQTLVNLILAVMVALGVFNNPEEKERF